MRFLSVATVLGFVSAEDGTCTGGLDQIGVEQSCLGRCHIYYVGNYGACFNYQFTDADVNSKCGSSPSTACKSTFNQAWDNDKANCGNCYYVEMPYADGTVTSTYIKVVDTNANEVKFEMGQQAWNNLCPFVCAGTGECGHSESMCTYGILSGTSLTPFDSCTVQYAPIKFKRVDCDSGAEVLDSTTTTTTTATTTTAATTTTTTTPVNLGVTTAVTSTTASSSVLVNPGTTYTVIIDQTVALTQGASDDVPTACAAAVGYPSIPSWNEECKALCHYYYEQRPHCPEGADLDKLIQCVLTKHPYCQKV